MESARFRLIIRIDPIHESLDDGIQVRFRAGILQGSAYIGSHVQQPGEYRKPFIFIVLQVSSCSGNLHY